MEHNVNLLTEKEIRNMKRVISIIGILAVSALVFSCSKSNTTPQTPAEEGKTISIQDLDPSVYLLSFSGSFESAKDADETTKVTINLTDGAQAFETGDEVMVYVPATSTKGIYAYDEADHDFKPKNAEQAVAIGANYAYVYYPAAEFELADGKVNFTMPEAVTELPGKKTPIAGIIPAGARVDGKPAASFKNLGSILRFSFTAANEKGETLTAVELSGEGTAFTGKGEVTWSENTAGGEPVLAALNGGNVVTVTLGTPVQLNNTETSDFFFFLPQSGEITNMKVKAIYGKKLSDVEYAPFEGFGRSTAMHLERGKLITVEKTLKGFFSGGDGSAASPYLIASADDFKAIAALANATAVEGGNGYDDTAARTFFGSAGVHYQQTANIDFEDADISASMIGSADKPFCGTYNGKLESNQFSLSNFKLDGTPSKDPEDDTKYLNEGIALFMAVDGAVLQNVSISGANVSGRKFSAGLVGYAKGAGLTIQNCSISNSTINDKDAAYGAGGLIGGIYGGTVSNCSATDMTISTDVENKEYFGGIICYINGSVIVSRCSLNGNTTVTNAQKFGGIVGQINNDNARIEDCHNHSKITGSKNYNGGICGVASKGTISNCTNDGEITGLSSTAGIVANLDGATVDHCTNSGTVSGTENYAAGIVAYHTKGNITNCVNTGNISADGAYVGGIAGMLKSSAAYGLIKSCRSNATLTGASDVAGIVGRVTFGVVMDCFAKGSATGGLNTAGIVGYAYSTDGNVAVMNCLSNVAVTCNASGNQHSGGVIGRATCVDAKYVYIGNCAGLNNVVKATESNAVRFGAFTGFTNAEKKSGSATANRVRIWNSYSLVDESNFQCANTSATADVGGFVGRMGAASDLGDCYYIIDGSKSTLNGSTYKNITQTTAAVIGGTGNIAVNPTRQGMSLEDSFLNVLNRCTYTSDGTTRLVAFTNYPMCDWTMTGANGEALSHPVQASLVALGAEFYE